MGTSALTIVIDGDKEEEILCMYRQSDGYEDGHGIELAKFLSGTEIVNGINSYSDDIANGAGCLAAFIVGHFKNRAGGIYLFPTGTRKDWMEFEYIVTASVGKSINFKCGEFDGKPEDYEAYVEKMHEDE